MSMFCTLVIVMLVKVVTGCVDINLQPQMTIS